MEVLRQPLNFVGAKIEQLALHPTANEPKAVLSLRAPLSRENGCALGCSFLWLGNGAPRTFEEYRLDDELTGVLVTFTGAAGGDLALTPEKIHGLAVYAEEQPETAGLGLRMRLHFTEGLRELLDLLQAQNKGQFDLTIAPRQGDLFAAASDLAAEE